MTYECNGNGNHIGILYGSQPCPLCASHAEIAELRKALDSAAKSLESLAYAGARDGNECLQDLIDVRGYSASRAMAARAALEDTNA